MAKYHARVERDGKFWLIYVPEIDRYTQSRSLREVPVMAADLVAVMLDIEPAEVELIVRIVLPKGVQQHLNLAAILRQAEAEARTKAAEESRAAARELAEAGWTVRDIGAALGVSHQRAQQLVTSD